MKNGIFEIILKEHKKQLKNLSKINKKLIISFVGIPGSGKTYLAKKLEKRYGGIRINSDDIRKIINNKITREESERETILKEYILNLLKKSPFINKFVILDSSIAGKYEEIYKISESKKWKMFIIKMITPKNLIIKRIKIKDKERLEKHPEDVDRWFKEYKEFNQKVNANFVFRKNSNLKSLFLKLNGILLKS